MKVSKFARHPPLRQVDETPRSMNTINRAVAAGSRAAFSLVELLVAGVIIAILVALLLPAIAQSREKSRKAGCQAVLHQVYLLTRIYADDHDGEMPLGSALFTNGKFPDCPSNTGTETTIGPHGYVRIPYYSWIPFYYHRQPGEKVKIDPQWVLVGDRRPWHDPNRIWEPPPVAMWTGKHNLLYGDGHLGWVQQSSPP